MEEKLFANNRYATSWPYYEDLLKKDSLNAELNYKLGICYLNSRSQKSKAVPYLKKAIKFAKDTLSSAQMYKSLAEASFHAANFDQAIENYEKYKKTIRSNKKDSLQIERISHKIEICKMAKEIKELKGIVASLADSRQANQKTSPADISTHSLTFKMPPDVSANAADREFFDDFPITLRAGTLSTPPQNPDTNEVMKEATIATSVDGQIILIYRNDKGICNLYASHLEGNSWTSPEKLNKIINTKGWEPDEFVSADGNTLYFASDRPGGYGGKDIYKSIKLSNGEWSRAQNLGEQINTPYDDEAPFIHPDGVTLYYSTKKNKKNGSYTIYTSSLSENGTWSNATSIGYPINQSTNIASPHKENSFIEKENYVTTFLNPKKTPLTLIKGKVLDKTGKIPGYTEITVTDNVTGETAGIYHTDVQTGQFIFILPPNGNSTITYNCDGYLFHQENVNTAKENNYHKINKTIELSPVAIGSEEMLTSVSFTNGKADQVSLMELNTLYEFLQKNTRLSIEIFAYQEKKVSTVSCNENTMIEIKTFLVDKGIDKERIETRMYKKPKKKHKKGDPEEQPGGIGIKIINIKQNNL
ncbi:MAG: hypothetical protein ACXVOH_08050 [Bacteroidia bacterium]